AISCPHHAQVRAMTVSGVFFPLMARPFVAVLGASCCPSPRTVFACGCGAPSAAERRADAPQQWAGRVSAGCCRNACRAPDLRGSGRWASGLGVAGMLADGARPSWCAVKDEQDLGLRVVGDGVEDA